VSVAGRLICRVLIRVGNSLTVIGCVGLLLGLLDIIPAQLFAIGISSGIRVIGSVAIAGCLLSAIGYGAIEYSEQ
jgi:hydroxyethylthiazole kinase-like sugar kinase family protein